MPQCVAARSALVRLEGEASSLWISQQVLREYLAATTRPQASAAALSMSDAISDVRSFQLTFNFLNDNMDVFERLLWLLATQSSAGKQVHDANLVATMLTHNIKRLLTFNVGDFQRYQPLIEIISS